jgi:hypothetical protein
MLSCGSATGSLAGVKGMRGGRVAPESVELDAIRRPRDTPIWKLEASLKCRSRRKGRHTPPLADSKFEIPVCSQRTRRQNREPQRQGVTVMSSKMSPERFERASVLCDVARALVEANGNPTPGIIPPMLEVERRTRNRILRQLESSRSISGLSCKTARPGSPRNVWRSTRRPVVRWRNP